MSANAQLGIIGLVTVGMRGDIQPFLALAGGLNQAGYSVIFMTHSIFQRVVEEAGFEFVGLAGNPAKLLKNHELQEALYNGNTTAQTRLFYEALSEHVEANTDVIYQVARKTPLDALLCNTHIAMECMSVGERLCLPTILATTAPSLPSSEVPPVGLVDKSVLDVGLFTSIAHKVSTALIWNVLGDSVNRVRNHLGLPAFSSYDITGLPQACLFSPLVQPKPADWGEEVSVTGYCCLPVGEFSPPPELEFFLEEGKPPIYMGFGSMPLLNIPELINTFAAILRKYELRGIFCSGWGELPPDFNIHQKDLLVIHGAPHEWLFPRCSMAIHHGGAGTTAASLRAGIPTIIFPAQGDQSFWAHRAAELGCGPSEYFGVDQLCRLTLEKQIILCMDHALQVHCQKFAAQLQQENGLTAFVDWFSPHFNRLCNRSEATFRWASDDDVLLCAACCTRFSLLNRRSHCRSCGDIFCKSCLTFCVVPSWPATQLACAACQRNRNLTSTGEKPGLAFFPHSSSSTATSSTLSSSPTSSLLAKELPPVLSSSPPTTTSSFLT